MDIGGWLRGLGLERYEQAFRENEIDLRVLPKLTADDLKELGVAAVGHRRLLIDAISALTAEGTGAVSAEAAPAAPARQAAEAERRQLTVMFCDLVGSTALSARFDPEDLREVIGAYHAAVAAEAARFDGYIAKYMGDGVLLYFGYPEAHEDDAERAVRTGLALAERVAGLETQAPLAARIGIATGLVVVGDLIGAGEAQERGVVGETPNLAARLQDAAPSGGVVIAEGTRRLLGDLFELRDLGAVAVKGFAAPVPVWQPLRPSAVESRFEALRTGDRTPLVGRQEELELLLRRWRQAAAGEGQVVLLSGEPGIGKSRLTSALRERLESEPHARLRYFCSPHHQDSALHPFIAQLERAAAFAHDDTPEQRLDKLTTVIAPGARDRDEVTLIADLLSVLPSGAADLGLTPQRKRERLLAALLRQLEALARRQPMLMVVEDLHWIDPSSRELLDLIVERVANLPVLLILTFRREFQAPWSGLPQVAALTLNRLDRRGGAAMVERIVGNRKLPDALTAEIVERADGVPLFVEELTRAVIEAGRGGEALADATPLPPSGVPPALHASLMARLDRLGPTAREVAQIGAVIGRDFSYQLLAPAAAPRTDAELADALGRLADAGLVFQRGAPPAATYLFKHALVRDAAYASLLRRRREELHGRIAAALEVDFPETVEAQPELLAQHFAAAGLTEQAVAAWQRAGTHAVARSANVEAAAHLTRGIEVLKILPESPERDASELVLRVALIGPLVATQGHASSEIERTATRALELSRRHGADTPALFWALYGANFFYEVRGEMWLARDLSERLLGVAERLQAPELLAYGHFNHGDMLFWFGELAVARSHLEQAIALYDPEWGREATIRYGSNCAADSYTFLGRVLWHLGYPDQALRYSERAVAIAAEVSNPFSQAVALSWTAALHQLRREAGRTLTVAEACHMLSTEQVIPFFAAHAVILRGWALVEQGRREEGTSGLRAGVDAYRALGAIIESPHWLALLAEACSKAGRIDEAPAILREALDFVERTGTRYHAAELYRLEGELRLARDAADAPAAEASFRRALDIARAQQAKSWELRAATSLARLWRHQGRRAEARDLLAPVYGWFTEGFDTADLKDAKALLEEL